MSQADILLTGARPWPPGGGAAGADAIAIRAGEVIALGPAAAVEALAGPATLRVDAGGATVTPGFTDSHIHLVAWARARSELQLYGIRRRADALVALAVHLAKLPGEAPVVGRGWAADEWEAPPDREALDRVAPARPVLLHSKDFHALWVNGAALERAGVTRATPDPPGGKIERARSGEPSGVIREHAVRMFESLIPPPGLATDRDAVVAATAELLSHGVTAIHDYEGENEASLLAAIARSEAPRLRVLMHVSRPGLDGALRAGIRSGAGDEWFRWGALKLFADGTLGSRTAAMLEPYDGTDDRGMELLPPAELCQLAARAFRGGLSLAVHAIGDRAVRNTLDALATLPPGGPAMPPRIEHVQLVHPDDMVRFAPLGVVASLQPTHGTSDAPLVERWWKSRVAAAYPWRSLLDRGVPLAFGSDAPVEEPIPAWGLHAAVTRTPRGGGQAPWTPAQRLSLDEALRAYTELPAQLAGNWPRLGRLAEGAIADLVVWDRDLHRAAPAELEHASPALTIQAGRVVFARAAGRTSLAATNPGDTR